MHKEIITKRQMVLCNHCHQTIIDVEGANVGGPFNADRICVISPVDSGEDEFQIITHTSSGQRTDLCTKCKIKIYEAAIQKLQPLLVSHTNKI